MAAHTRPSSAGMAAGGTCRPRPAQVRLVVCQLPIKSPWLNPIEPKWVHTQRRVVEPARLLPARELVERVCEALECTYHEHLPIPEKVA